MWCTCHNDMSCLGLILRKRNRISFPIKHPDITIRGSEIAVAFIIFGILTIRKSIVIRIVIFYFEKQ